MTALTVPPGRLLTIDDYAALGEDDRNRWELQEGNLVMSPSPPPPHMVAAAVVPDVHLDVQLAADQQPGTARRPDLVVVHRAEFERVDREGGLLRASAAVLVVEIVSPGSRRTDTVVKRSEYADAGIAHYWIVDATVRSLIACHLAGPFGYQDGGEVTGVFDTMQPCTVRIDLDALG